MRSVSISRGRGFSRRSTKEFVQFLFIAKGSVAEVQSQLYVALDQGYINQGKFDLLYTKSDEVARLISGFIRYLLNKDKPQALNQPNKLSEHEELNKPKRLKERK
jgi:four helix bundle protein